MKDLISKGVPFKKTNFIETHKLSPPFFRVMEDLKIIKEVSFGIKDGALYSWEYKPAGNEIDSKVSTIVVDKLQNLNRKNYEMYSTPEYKAKKAAEKRRKDAEAKLNPDFQMFTMPRKHHGGLGKTTMVIDMPVKPLLKEEPAQLVNPVHEVQKIVMPIPHIVELPKPSDMSGDKPDYLTAAFSFTGKLSKVDLLNKILALIEDKTIGSFSVHVTY